MTRSQAVTARALLGWSPERLARASGVPVSSVYMLARLGSAGPEHDERIRATLEQAGVVFTNGKDNGVKLIRPDS
jgi:DNA-directed RNA polymerase specialized sigma24 family protein